MKDVKGIAWFEEQIIKLDNGKVAKIQSDVVNVIGDVPDEFIDEWFFEPEYDDKFLGSMDNVTKKEVGHNEEAQV